MRITAITRFKHGKLFEILKRLGWAQADLARASNLSQFVIGRIINLVRRPTQEEADAIQIALGNAGEYLDVLSEWPETFQGLKPGFKVEQSADVELDRLIDHPEVLQIAAPETFVMPENVEKALRRLKPRERTVLEDVVMGGEKDMDVARAHGITRQNSNSIKHEALRKLKHHIFVNPIETP